MIHDPSWSRALHFLSGCGALSRRRFMSRLVAAAASAYAASCHPRPLRQRTASGQIHLNVFDGASGTGMPARFHLELPDGSHWTPLSHPGGHGHGGPLPEVLSGDRFQPMLAPALARETSRTSLGWTHLSEGRAILEVPAGRCRLYLSRGFEYLPVQLDLEVGPGRTVRVERALERWIDMPQQGLFSGDIHQHFSRRSPADNRLWEALARAEDLHVINTMVLKHGEPHNRYEQYAYGRAGTHQRGHYVIAPGQEFRDNDLSGHMTIGGISQVIEPVSTGPKLGLRGNFPPFAVACREARRQGAVVGWAHGAVSGDWSGSSGMESVSVEAALGLLDFLEVVQFLSFLGKTFWYRLLGAGIQLAGVGGSDFPFGLWLAPWYPSFGQERTYVQVEGELSSDRWFQGVREGKAFASNGPMIWCEAEGRTAGQVLDIDQLRSLAVRAEARAAYPLQVLEVVVNGEVAALGRPSNSDPRRFVFEGQVPVRDSCWIAARARGVVEAETFGGTRPWPLVAHSGPIYVQRRRQPVRIAEDLHFLIAHTQRFREFVVKNGIFDIPEHKSVFLANIDEAISIYRQRARGAG